MPRNFEKIACNADVLPLLLELQSQPLLWNRNKARLRPDGPHHQTDDIWLRYKDETENIEKNDYSNFADPHDPIWYPAFYELPASRRLIFDLMARVQGERLGGILLYRVPPGKEILPHVDKGWIVDYYDRFNINIKSQKGCRFHYEDGEVMESLTGDVYWFINSKTHWVTNESNDDQVILTVCIKTHRFIGK